MDRGGKQVVENTYVLMPEYKHKFREQHVKEIIREVLAQKLENVQYHAEGSNILAKQVADEIKERLKEEPAIDNRYKIVSQVAIIEQRGQGIRIGHRLFCDEDTDGYATESYSNDHLYCVATAYGLYYY